MSDKKDIKSRLLIKVENENELTIEIVAVKEVQIIKGLIAAIEKIDESIDGFKDKLLSILFVDGLFKRVGDEKKGDTKDEQKSEWLPNQRWAIFDC